LNPVCLNPDGSAYTGALITNPAQCTGQLSPNPAFNPVLACVDLTRTGALPAANGCPASHSALYTFNGTGDIRETALFYQDTITLKNWSFNLGLRLDTYNGISQSAMLEPRLGLAYNVKATNTVIRASYARTMETPFNENLVLASLGCNDPVVNAIMSTLGACNPVPLVPGRRNEFHAGLQQASESTSLSMANTSGSAPTVLTISACSALRRSPIHRVVQFQDSGYAIRASIPNFHGFSAFVVMSSVAARSSRRRWPVSAPRRVAARFSALITMNSSTKPLTCNTSLGRTGRGWASTGATIAAW